MKATKAEPLPLLRRAQTTTGTMETKGTRATKVTRETREIQGPLQQQAPLVWARMDTRWTGEAMKSHHAVSGLATLMMGTRGTKAEHPPHRPTRGPLQQQVPLVRPESVLVG